MPAPDSARSAAPPSARASTTSVGVSLKMYFGHQRARQWFTDVAARLREHAALRDGSVDVFVVPTYLQIPAALEAFSGTGVRIGAQDVSTQDAGAYTGEVSGAELAELGVVLAEVGHAERRRLFGEDEAVVAAKTAAALRHGLTPLLCIGEPRRTTPAQAASATAGQLHSALADAPAGPVTIAYEPVWAIGAPGPAPVEHVRTVARHLRDELAGLPQRAGSTVIYGGSAGPGLLTALDGAVDGVFLGRSAHDPDAFLAVIDEAAALQQRQAVAR